MTDLDIFNPTKVRGLFEALTAVRDALAAELAEWKRMRNEAMAQATFNRNGIDALAAELAETKLFLADEKEVRRAAESEQEALANTVKRKTDLINLMVERMLQMNERIAAFTAALPHLLDFRLSPTFDAKGTYTQAKADEWAKRLADFSVALAAINAIAPPAAVAQRSPGWADGGPFIFGKASKP